MDQNWFLLLKTRPLAQNILKLSQSFSITSYELQKSGIKTQENLFIHVIRNLFWDPPPPLVVGWVDLGVLGEI